MISQSLYKLVIHSNEVWKAGLGSLGGAPIAFNLRRVGTLVLYYPFYSIKQHFPYFPRTVLEFIGQVAEFVPRL